MAWLDSAATLTNAHAAANEEGSILTLAYIALTVIGGGYVLVSLFLGHGDFHAAGGHGHGHDDGGSHGHAAPEFHFPLFSPLALATLFGALGAWGLIARGALDLADTASLAVAVPAAIATAYLVTYLGWRLATSSRGTSAIRAADLEGALGEVITPIPEGGLGEVAAMVQGQRFSNAARAADGAAVPRGAMVRVVAQVGGTLVVKKEG